VSTFSRDTVERAVRSTLSGAFGWILSDTISHWHYLHLDEQAVLWAAGCSAFSVLLSWAARRFGTPGTASLSRNITYEKD
jgi:hypothetical protein